MDVIKDQFNTYFNKIKEDFPGDYCDIFWYEKLDCAKNCKRHIEESFIKEIDKFFNELMKSEIYKYIHDLFMYIDNCDAIGIDLIFYTIDDYRYDIHIIIYETNIYCAVFDKGGDNLLIDSIGSYDNIDINQCLYFINNFKFNNILKEY